MQTCKTRWTNLLIYRKEVKADDKPSGSGAGTNKWWKLIPFLTLFNPAIKDRPTGGNTPQSPTAEDTAQSQESEDLVVLDLVPVEDVMMGEEQEPGTSSLSISPPTSPDTLTTVVKQGKKRNSEFEDKLLGILGKIND